jgi:hypothetical protein
MERCICGEEMIEGLTGNVGFVPWNLPVIPKQSYPASRCPTCDTCPTCGAWDGNKHVLGYGCSLTCPFCGPTHRADLDCFTAREHIGRGLSWSEYHQLLLYKLREEPAPRLPR